MEDLNLYGAAIISPHQTILENYEGNTKSLYFQDMFPENMYVSIVDIYSAVPFVFVLFLSIESAHRFTRLTFEQTGLCPMSVLYNSLRIETVIQLLRSDLFPKSDHS